METTTTVSTALADDITTTTTEVVAMSEYEKEVLAHMRFQTSTLQFLLVCIVAAFIWKFLKQFF